MDASIIIATRNRASLLANTLRSISEQNLNGIRLEIWVVDNGSTDETAAVLKQWQEKIPLNMLYQPLPGKNRAINLALHQVSGELVIFTDDDIIAHKNWISELVDSSRRWPQYDIFGGIIEPLYPPDAPSWLINHELAAAFFSKFVLQQDEGPMERVPFGANFALRRHLLYGRRFPEDIGPDGTKTYAMGSETALLEEIIAEGHIPIYVPIAKIQHVVLPNQLKPSFFKERGFRYGNGDAKLTPLPGNTRWVLGIPRFLVRELVVAWCEMIVTLLFGTPGSRLDALIVYHQIRGKIFYFRSKRYRKKHTVRGS